jgi:hypothetical protein
LLNNAVRRRRIGQQQIADALRDYYGDLPKGYGWYSARYGHDTEVVTSIVTCPDWLDLECPLDATHDRLKLARATTDGVTRLDEEAANAAAQRLAEAQVTGTVLVDRPLYRLFDIPIKRGEISGSVAITHFAQYALTMDLLEGELIDALAAGVSARPGLLPLRDLYLPDMTSVLNVADRLCVGGPVALCAIARPADPYRGSADYLLLVQERSCNVLNTAQRLTVLPKGFHQPMTDYRADARIGATLRREMEEELFGRHDVDNTVTAKYVAEPMHPTRLSEPFRWLMANSEYLHIECTGFGFNLISGNYEFACLIIIDSEDFWSHFGGQIEANWESSSLRQNSSLDAEALAELIQDPVWCNEGLFALLQGLRRLRQIGEDRVNLPEITWKT